MRIRPAILLLTICVAVSPVSWGQSKNLSLNDILARMQQADSDSRDHSVAYTVTREYQLSAEGAQQPTSNVVADISFAPPAAKEYLIVKTEGSDRGTTIVKKVLDQEAAMAAHHEQHELTVRNYDFALLGRATIDGRDCYLLQLSPKRQAVELVRGKAWVDAQDFSVRRIEGLVAKNPSLWVKNVNLTINYGEVNGVWLQTSSHAVAELRLLGTHVLNSRELDVRSAGVSAQRHFASPNRGRAAASRSVSDAATWIAR